MRPTLSLHVDGTTPRPGADPALWIAMNDLLTTSGHPFYRRLNQILDAHGFDAFVEEQCSAFYATRGRPSLAPGVHVRLPRTRRLIDLATHQAVFTWVLQILTSAGLVTGKTIGHRWHDLGSECRAAQQRTTRQWRICQTFLTQLAQTPGIATPTRADLARVDRKRPKKGSNQGWIHPHDSDARIMKMTDGRTHLAHKAEHAVDMETGAVIAVTLHGADQGDTTTIQETVPEAAEQLAAASAADKTLAIVEEIVADKGYHSNQTPFTPHRRRHELPALAG